MTDKLSSDKIISEVSQDIDSLVSELQHLKDSPAELSDAKSFQQLEDEVHSMCQKLADKIVAMNLQKHLSGEKK